MYVLFGISFLLFYGMFHYFFATKRPGVFPPKKILKQKAQVFALGGIVFLLLGYIFRLFQ